MVVQSNKETAARIMMKDEVRDFVEYIDDQTAAARARGMQHTPFAPRTLEFVEKMRPLLTTISEGAGKKVA